MSRKQRVLMELRTAGSGLLQAAETESKETMGAAARALAATRDLCRQGLPENSYAKYGEVPEFSGLPDILWGMLRPVIDKDGERYEQTTIQKQYAVYCREIKKQGYEPLSLDEWKRTISGDIG